MSRKLIICCLLAAVTSDVAWANHDELWLDDLEQRIAAHRRMIRMCGPLSVLRMCALKGRPVDVDATLASYRCRRQRGVSVCEVVNLSRDLGLNARGVRLAPPSLDDLPTPCIILINQDQHCAVLQAVQTRNGTAQVWDPADLSTKNIDLRALNQRWSGHAILFDMMPTTQWLINVANVGALVLTIALLAWSRRSVRRNVNKSVQ